MLHVSGELSEPMASPADSAEVSSIQVRFEGLKRVSPHALIVECGSLQSARTLEELKAAVRDAHDRIEELKLFKSLRADASVGQNGAVEVTFIAEERTRQFSVSGNVDKRGEMSADVKMEQPALLGGPLSATGSCGSTMSQAREFLFRLSTPRIFGHRWTWSLDAAKSVLDERQASSYRENSSKVITKITDPTEAHSVSLEAALRDILPAAASGSRLPSLEVLQSRLRSVKTSANYSFVTSKEHPTGLEAFGFSPAFQSSFATRLRTDLEVAGFPGDARFVRGEAHAGVTCSLPWDMEGYLASGCGLLLPAGSGASCLQDRFFLGGASGCSTSVLKGFAHRGIGPVGDCAARGKKSFDRSCDALGGEAMLSTFAAVSAPLVVPHYQPGLGVGARVFGFCGIGSLVDRSRVAPQALLKGFGSGLRASIGVGASLPLAGGGSLELTFACPLRNQKSDVLQMRQLGLRIDVQG